MKEKLKLLKFIFSVLIEIMHFGFFLLFRSLRSHCGHFIFPKDLTWILDFALNILCSVGKLCYQSHCHILMRHHVHNTQSTSTEWSFFYFHVNNQEHTSKKRKIHRAYVAQTSQRLSESYKEGKEELVKSVYIKSRMKILHFLFFCISLYKTHKCTCTVCRPFLTSLYSLQFIAKEYMEF